MLNTAATAATKRRRYSFSYLGANYTYTRVKKKNETEIHVPKLQSIRTNYLITVLGLRREGDESFLI